MLISRYMNNKLITGVTLTLENQEQTQVLNYQTI